MGAVMLSYADALAHAIRWAGSIEQDGYRFERLPGHQLDGLTGRHTLTYQLVGTGKTYRVMIEPVPETHRPANTEESDG